MTFRGTRRTFAFVVHRESGAWKYTINKETFRQHSHRDRAISAAIRHIDKFLFEAARQEMDQPQRSGARAQTEAAVLAAALQTYVRQAAP